MQFLQRISPLQTSSNKSAWLLSPVGTLQASCSPRKPRRCMAASTAAKLCTEWGYLTGRLGFMRLALWLLVCHSFKWPVLTSPPMLELQAVSHLVACASSTA